MRMTDVSRVGDAHDCPRCLARDRKDRADAKIAARQNRIGWWLLGVLVALTVLTAIVSP